MTLSLTNSVSQSVRTLLIDIQKETLQTCDLWDIWSEWWGNMTWPTFWQHLTIWTTFDSFNFYFGQLEWSERENLNFVQKWRGAKFNQPFCSKWYILHCKNYVIGLEKIIFRNNVSILVMFFMKKLTAQIANMQNNHRITFLGLKIQEMFGHFGKIPWRTLWMPTLGSLKC